MADGLIPDDDHGTTTGGTDGTDAADARTLADELGLDEFEGRVDPRQLDHVRALAAMAPGKPWMRELAQQERDRLALKAHNGDGVVERRRDRLRQGGGARLSVRLDPDDLYALERRAAYLGLKPSGLARNLIRIGVAPTASGETARLFAELDDVLGRLRRAVG